MRRTKRLGWVVFIAMVSPALLHLLSARALEVPPFTGWVVDRAQLISSSAAEQLSAELRAHEQKTSNQVAVLTLPSLEGEPVEDVAQRVFVAWGLGRKGTDNGVLLLVVPKERKIRIHVGYGLEGALTDVKASRIIRNDIVPRFRAGDFSGGITAGVAAILTMIEGEYHAPEEAARPGDLAGLLPAVAFAVIAGTIIGVLFSQVHRAVGTAVGSGVSLLAAPWVTQALLAASATLVLVALLNASFPAAGGELRRRRRGRDDSLWYTTQGGGWSSGDWGGLSSDSGFSGGGGGDSGGGGASGDW